MVQIREWELASMDMIPTAESIPDEGERKNIMKSACNIWDCSQDTIERHDSQIMFLSAAAPIQELKI